MASVDQLIKELVEALSGTSVSSDESFERLVQTHVTSGKVVDTGSKIEFAAGIGHDLLYVSLSVNVVLTIDKRAYRLSELSRCEVRSAVNRMISTSSFRLFKVYKNENSHNVQTWELLVYKD